MTSNSSTSGQGHLPEDSLRHICEDNKESGLARKVDQRNGSAYCSFSHLPRALGGER